MEDGMKNQTDIDDSKISAAVEIKEDDQNLKGITVLCGDLERAMYCKPRKPFDEVVCGFLGEVSSVLMKDPASRQYPDIVTFGFFCRKANLHRLQKQYEGRLDGAVGRGLAFHIAPSNVPINFAYTLISGLLAGNANIVKASSKDFMQTRIVTQAIKKVLEKEEFAALTPYITVVMYDRDRQDLTEYFSSKCNVRVIWGGDQTIAKVKAAPLPPRGIDICFADRYSLAVIKAEKLVALSENISRDSSLDVEKFEKIQDVTFSNSARDTRRSLEALAQDFYNDTYLFDQNACTSPRLIYWVGDNETVEKAKKLFWQAVYDNIKDRYQVEAETAVNKLLAVDRTALAIPDSSVEESPDNRIVRVSIGTLPENIPELREAGGFFHEFTCENLEPLAGIVTEKYQTLSYFGFDPKKLRDFVTEYGLRGIDRITPMGHTSDWGLTWDGYDLIETMARKIVAF